MAYKEKTCPKCGVTHNKRGEFCSRSCGNSRTPTEEHRQSVSEAKKEWHRTSDTAAVVRHNWASQGLNKEPDPVPPMVDDDYLDSNQFVAGGDVWTIAD